MRLYYETSAQDADEPRLGVAGIDVPPMEDLARLSRIQTVAAQSRRVQKANVFGVRY